MVEIEGYAVDNLDTTALKVQNGSSHASAKALHVSLGSSLFEGRLHVGNLDGGIPGGANGNLNLGTSANDTNSVVVSRSGQLTRVQGQLQVDEQQNALGDLRVGSATAAGKIDSGGSALSPQDVKVGTQTVSADVEIGRSTKLVKAVGDVQVGTLTGVGKIDAAGNPTAKNLKIGSGTTTASVELARSGQTIDMFGQARLNGNAVILNGASSITSTGARGYKDNPTGFGTGGASIDFYIGGVVKWYVDANGGHNA